MIWTIVLSYCLETFMKSNHVIIFYIIFSISDYIHHIVTILVCYLRQCQRLSCQRTRFTRRARAVHSATDGVASCFQNTRLREGQGDYTARTPEGMLDVNPWHSQSQQHWLQRCISRFRYIWNMLSGLGEQCNIFDDQTLWVLWEGYHSVCQEPWSHVESDSWNQSWWTWSVSQSNWVSSAKVVGHMRFVSRDYHLSRERPFGFQLSTVWHLRQSFGFMSMPWEHIEIVCSFSLKKRQLELKIRNHVFRSWRATRFTPKELKALHHRATTLLGEQSAAVLLNLPTGKKCISQRISSHR